MVSALNSLSFTFRIVKLLQESVDLNQNTSSVPPDNVLSHKPYELEPFQALDNSNCDPDPSSVSESGQSDIQTDHNPTDGPMAPFGDLDPVEEPNPFAFQFLDDDTSETESIEEFRGDVGEDYPESGSESEGGRDDSVFATDDPPVSEDGDLPFFAIPECVTKLRADLRNGYVPPPKPTEPFELEDLDRSETLSLRLYMAWRQTNGTVRAYNAHRWVLSEATDIDILSLHLVRKLVLKISKLEPRKIDMCPHSCMAYTGEHQDKRQCDYRNPTTKKVCGEPRFKLTPTKKEIPRAQYTVLPVMASIRAMFANAQTSSLLRYRDRRLQEILKMVATVSDVHTKARYSDFADGAIHQLHYQTMGLFQDPRDMALALSSDGAQLMMKKQSSTWVLIIILMNLPPELRYHSQNVVINFATPGPHAPGNIDSFIRPLFEELATSGEGIWLWDAIDSSYFLHRAHTVMFNGDMLGSAKVNGMAGHSAKHGDRFSLIPGARTSIKNSKPQYYPLRPPQNDIYNDTRPPDFSTIESIPLRTQGNYWEILSQLTQPGQTITAQKLLVTQTGVSRMPLAAAPNAFIHPSFFPLDPFHLFYENCMPFFWDCWTTDSKPTELMHLPARKAQKFGELVVEGMQTLPPSFCGPVRDPHLKRQSQYKAYEWMALLHWYTLAIGIELEFNPMLLHVFSQFAAIVEFSMTIAPRSQEDLDRLQESVMQFLNDYESLFVGNDPSRIYRCRLCVFQLFHVPMHIRWFGSIRMGSQATVERSIGEVGHKIHSKKEPFTNLTNIIIEQECIRIAQSYYPHLSKNLSNHSTSVPPAHRLFHDLPPGQIEDAHLDIIESLISTSNPGLEGSMKAHLFGKLRLREGRMLRSKISEHFSNSARNYRWFEVRFLQ
jgi:hypothetical protein